MKTIDISCGNGGLEMNRLINEYIKPSINNKYLEFPVDSAVFPSNFETMLFTTDSHIIDPVFFPGGDIGKLAVCGTLNDLLVSGGKPLFLSLSFIIEEGFAIKDLEKIMESIRYETEKAGVKIITGDTKIVEKGKGDRIFINTSGIAEPLFDPLGSFSNIEPGDDIILTGDIARHGIAIMVQREGIKLQTDINSDIASLHPIMFALRENNINPGFMTDPTRGGIASALNDIAVSAKVGVNIFEDYIPVNPQVHAVCDILGLNPYESPSEGIAIIIVKEKDSKKALKIIKDCDPIGKDAQIIGKITDKYLSKVVLTTKIKTNVLINMPEGINLPRIC